MFNVCSLRHTEKELQMLLLEPTTCPGLFYSTPAQDGPLSRLRIPAGLLTAPQSEAIVHLADQFGVGAVQITNRANVQIRGVQSGIPTATLKHLQAMGLASPIASVDAIRNIMGSPTAGIDRQQLVDTRPLVQSWNRYLISRPDFAVLSPKFSVCFAGGESVCVGDRPNDISLVALEVDGQIHFQLHLSLGERGDTPQAVGVLIKPESTLEVLAALAEVYRDYTIQGSDRAPKPRLRELLHNWGVEAYLRLAEKRLSWRLQRSEPRINPAPANKTGHLGVHPQRQLNFSYVGVVLPLGRLTTHQLQGLTSLATQYGSSTLRLTPWQNVLLPDIANAHIIAVQQGIEALGLSTSTTHPWSAIVSCSGMTGCKSSATDTQSHALALASYLEQHVTLDRPLNIHLSGCEKSCAQHYPSDIVLVGVATADRPSYTIYVGSGSTQFGQELYREQAFESLPVMIAHLWQTYQNHRINPDETLGEFASRHSIAELRQMISTPNLATGGET